MRKYFEKMDDIGKALSPKAAERAQESVEKIRGVEATLAAEIERVKCAGIPASDLKDRGQMTAWERLDYLVDPGTWCPLHTLYDPRANEEGTTGVIDGLAKISGKWAVVIASDNKVLAGAWIAGQAENILRVTDLAKRLHLPLVWVLNCSGVKLPEQEEVYPDRRGNGTPFYRHTQLEQLGVPVLVAIFGTNPAGGGYHGISPTILVAHKDANIAVGGAGIVGGMAPKGGFDLEGAQMIIDAQKKLRAKPPGRVEIHYNETGFFRHVEETETGVLDVIKKYMADMPAFNPSFFRVASPAEPKFPCSDIDAIIPFDQKQTYKVEEVIARLVDNSEHTEFRPGYGPEMYTGLVKIDGFLCGLVANRQGFLGAKYPEYADYTGIGGKLYRQGLIKMNEFVTLCGRDRLPIIWLQDTSGIDVGDQAEKAELLGLGQSLIYSIQQSNVPMMAVVLRKGTAAAHYVLGGPQANDNNAFTLGTPTTEIYVMHGETAAVASFSRRLVKDQEAGKSLQPTIDKMNALAKKYHDRSRPEYCAKRGFVDETVRFADLRKYVVAFADGVYQNPVSLCPFHQMILPRVIKG
jgi:glutaconyl-CoA decarboxylase subunit alpha